MAKGHQTFAILFHVNKQRSKNEKPAIYMRITDKTNKRATQPNKLVGTWRLIEFADFDSLTGNWEYLYGKNPKGYFTYTGNGIVSLNISSETPLRISEDSAKNYSINLYKFVNNNSLGYFGTYSVVKGMLQHSRSSSGIKELADINKLADEYLRLAYHGLRAKEKSFNATLKTEYDESIGNINIIHGILEEYYSIYITMHFMQ